METCYKIFHKEVPDSVKIEKNRFYFEPKITHKVAYRHWRISEVGISYSGSNYAEGKKRLERWIYRHLVSFEI
jgi:hypothetical protein